MRLIPRYLIPTILVVAFLWMLYVIRHQEAHHACVVAGEDHSCSIRLRQGTLRHRKRE